MLVSVARDRQRYECIQVYLERKIGSHLGLVVILLEQTGVFLRFVALARVFVLFISGEMLL